MGIKPMFRMRFGCAGFLAIAAVSLASPAIANDVAQCQATDPFRDGQAAYTICSRTIQNSVKNDLIKAKAFAQRGEAYYWAEQFDAAISDFNAALAISPELNETRIQRGWARIRVGDVESAYRDFTDAIERDSESGRAMFALAFLSRDPGVQRKGYEQALVLKPDYYLADGNIAIIDGASAITRDAALKRYNRLLSLGAKKLNTVQFFNSGGFFYTKDYYTNILFSRALLLYDMARFEESLKDFKELQRLSSMQPMPYIKEAEANFALKDYVAAAVAADNAFDVCTRGNRPALCGRAIEVSVKANLLLGKSEEVIKRKGDVDNLDFDDYSRALISLTLAQAYKSLGKRDEARMAFRRVGELYPELLSWIVNPMVRLGYYEGTWKNFADGSFWNGLEACLMDTKCVVDI
jgi:tetratricopeptide (TPR) repeat protein